MSAILKEIPDDERLEYLKGAWHECYLQEKEANKNRILVEREIFNLLPIEPEGSYKFDEVTIVTGFNRAWDQEKLFELQAEIKPEFFPFHAELKESRKDSKIIEDRFPDLWEKIKPALTTKPKKPSFSFKEKT